MCRMNEVSTCKVLTPGEIRYKIGPMMRRTIDSPMVMHDKGQPLDDSQEEKMKRGSQRSDLVRSEDFQLVATDKQHALESLPLKRHCSDDTLSSPPSVSITSLESDSTPSNDLDDLFHGTTSGERQAIHHQTQAKNFANRSPQIAQTDDSHQVVKDGSDAGDASENDSSVVGDSSWVICDRCSISRSLFQNSSSLERESPTQSTTQSDHSTHHLSPAIKILMHDKIPICLNGPWRGLKRPHVDHRIVEELAHCKTVLLSPLPPLSIRTPSTTRIHSGRSCCSITKTRPERKDQVRFDTVHHRFFHQTIGDNPSVPIGTPITLDWTYEDDEERIPIDDFEQSRLTSRKKGNNRLVMHRLALSYYQRRNILSYYAGCTEEQLNRAEREVARARRQRQITAFFSDLWRIEDFVTSFGRKTKRLFQQRRQRS